MLLIIIKMEENPIAEWDNGSTYVLSFSTAHKILADRDMTSLSIHFQACCNA
jgi:hypothetical protein